MSGLRGAVGIVWVAFWVYWLISALGVKRGTWGSGGIRLRILAAVVVLALFHFVRPGGLDVHSAALAAVGLVIVLCGLAFAVWARVHLGRNWGMPMSRKEEPELVTSGPYRMVRHPIYTGLIVAVVGTALAVNLIALAIAVIVAALFWYSASVEERDMAATFPTAYPAYRAHTKMLIPFVL
jgi:protein-S-isoprenylcysteine O-methyltransferase Ste14